MSATKNIFAGAAFAVGALVATEAAADCNITNSNTGQVISYRLSGSPRSAWESCKGAAQDAIRGGLNNGRIEMFCTGTQVCNVRASITGGRVTINRSMGLN